MRRGFRTLQYAAGLDERDDLVTARPAMPELSFRPNDRQAGRRRLIQTRLVGFEPHSSYRKVAPPPSRILLTAYV